jgi:hypothetical protein
MIANEATREILKEIKSISNNNGHIDVDFNVEGIAFVISINTGDTGHTEFNSYPFIVKTKADYSGIIYFDILLDVSFSNKNYTQINNEIYEGARHEVEHISNFKLEKNPDNGYKYLLNSLMGIDKKNLNSVSSMLNYIKLVSQYITSEDELTAYSRSILYAAKKQNRNAGEVISQVFNRAFFNNNRKYMLLVKDNEEAQKMINNTRESIMSKIREFYPEKIRLGPFR